MPLYEYECTACHRHTEKIQKFSDPEITACPYCGGELKRVISAPAFALKGGGWYADGYGNAKPSGGGEGGAKDVNAPAADSSKTDGGKQAAGTPAAPASAPAAPAAASAPAATTPASSSAGGEKK